MTRFCSGMECESGSCLESKWVNCAAMEDPRHTQLRERLAAHWQDRSPADIANRVAGPLYGSGSGWDFPDDLEPKHPLIHLAVGIPDAEALPKAALAEAFASEFDKPGDVPLRYGFGLGPTPLRQWLVERRNREEGVDIDETWYQVTNGSAGAIDNVVRSLIDPGDVIVAEDPTYMGTLANFRGVQADVRFVPVDHDGLDTEALAGILESVASEGKRVKIIYTISAFQNPTGGTLTLERRHQLLELARRHDAVVLDDEAYRDLWFDTPPPPALSTLADGWGVITVGTFSKTVATGLRVGWIQARPEFIDLFSKMRFGHGQNQLGLWGFTGFLESGGYEPHLEQVRSLYRDKRDAIHDAMQREVGDHLQWDRPDGGFYLWPRLGDGLDELALWRTAHHEGVAINRGTTFMAAGSRQGPHLRIAYPWTPLDQLPEAARRLRIACERVLDGEPA